MNKLCCKLQVFLQGKQCQFEFFIINNLPTHIEYAFQSVQSARGGLSGEKKQCECDFECDFLPHTIFVALAERLCGLNDIHYYSLF